MTLHDVIEALASIRINTPHDITEITIKDGRLSFMVTLHERGHIQSVEPTYRVRGGVGRAGGVNIDGGSGFYTPVTGDGGGDGHTVSTGDIYFPGGAGGNGPLPCGCYGSCRGHVGGGGGSH